MRSSSPPSMKRPANVAVSEPARSMAGARAAREWNAATRRATAARWASSNEGSATIVASRRSAGSRRITTRCSMVTPVSSTTSCTPRYTSGASRRLSCTSRWQSARRSSRVEKSRNGVVTGLCTLYTRSPMKNSTEIWVSTTAARSISLILRPGGSPRQRPRSRIEVSSPHVGHHRGPGEPDRLDRVLCNGVGRK